MSTNGPILPWTSNQLRELLEQVINHGTEANKIDFKKDIATNTPEQKADLLKDISAIANTFDDDVLNDHGFLIFGVEPGRVVGSTETDPDGDHFQAQIEQLLRSYIAPFFPIHVLSFTNEAGVRWGAIVIPPRNAKPYMFVKEYSCQIPAKSRRRGEWFVRRGSTTDVGTPEDLLAINSRQTEAMVGPLRESIQVLQLRIAKTEEQYNSALLSALGQALGTSSSQNTPKGKDRIASSEQSMPGSLAERFRHRLRGRHDALADDLVANARDLRNWLSGSDSSIPWVPPSGDRQIIEVIEERTRDLQAASALIALNDREESYTEALFRSLRTLAVHPSAPAGTMFNRIGESLRYYPLCIVLYTLFICGVRSERAELLARALSVPLKGTRHQRAGDITACLDLVAGANGFVNQALGQRWYVPVSERILQLFTDHISELIPDWSQPEVFTRGEFVLALAHVDGELVHGSAQAAPSEGTYLYRFEAGAEISDFLSEYPEWLIRVFRSPLTQVLASFDRNVQNAYAPRAYQADLPSTLEVWKEAEKTRRPGRV